MKSASHGMRRSWMATCLLAFVAGLPAEEPHARRGDGPLPPRALARLGSFRFYHGPGVQYAVLSPDGSRIASSVDRSFYWAAEDITVHPACCLPEAYWRTILLWDS